MEEAALAEKSWQLTGEVQARARPLDSLLQEDLEFEQQTRTGVCAIGSCVHVDIGLEFIVSFL